MSGLGILFKELFLIRGTPEHIRSVNGPEFIARAIGSWLEIAKVSTLYIEPSSPWENGYIESFNSRVRDELLESELLTCLAEAKMLSEQWRLEYNHCRPLRPWGGPGGLCRFAGRGYGRGFAPACAPARKAA